MAALVLGGTFNPVHFGHLRLAVEASESLGCPRSVWVPGYRPHYRETGQLLSFDLRSRLLDVATDGMAGTSVSDVERRHDGPAYSFDILRRLAGELGDDDLGFVVGIEQFVNMRSWYRGVELADLADIVVAGRDGEGERLFRQAVKRSWPEAGEERGAPGMAAVFRPEGGRRLILLDLPRLDISSSRIRRRWLDGRSIRHLLPDPVLDLLEAHRADVTEAWRQGPPDGRTRAIVWP